MLDWYGDGVAQTATAQTTQGDVLDAARPFAGLRSGTWVVYTVCGSVDFVFTQTNGTEALVSGVFFGPPPGTPTTTNMLVDTSGGLSQVVAETDGGGVLSAYYVRAGDELLEVMRPASGNTWSTRFVHHDAIGSVRTLTDEGGTITDTRAYEAFGTTNVHAGGDRLAYGFAGEPFEATSSLAYHRARWMDARVGRFAGMDPSPGREGVPISLHRFLYASANPTNDIDPDGRESLAGEMASITISFIQATLAVAKPIAQAISIVCQAESAASIVGVDPFSRSPCHIDPKIYRTGTSYESPARLERLSSLAESSGIGLFRFHIHGVSASLYQPFFDYSQSTRDTLQEAGFFIFPTPYADDFQHLTIVLPKPVSPDDAFRFNSAFGRSRGGLPLDPPDMGF